MLLAKKNRKKDQATRINIYVKPVDFELYDWARSRRQSLSEVIALALQEYRKKRDK
jgi:hypothetical protein